MMSFGQHLEELRRRLIFALLGLVPILIGAIYLGKSTLSLLIEPARERLLEEGLPGELITTGPLEAFTTFMHMVFVLTLLVGSPWILWQLWLFVSPGLVRAERRFVYILAPLSVALTISAVAFLYYLMLPVVLSFFINFGLSISPGTPKPPTVVPLPEGLVLPHVPVLEGEPPEPEAGSMWFNRELNEIRVAVPTRGGADEVLQIFSVPVRPDRAGVVPQFRISEYTKLILSLGMAFSVGFQMPVAVLLLGWVGIVQPDQLRKKRKFVLFGCAIAGAFLTPADPVSMLMLALPLYLLYEFGLLLILILPASRIAGSSPENEDA